MPASKIVDENVLELANFIILNISTIFFTNFCINRWYLFFKNLSQLPDPTYSFFI